MDAYFLLALHMPKYLIINIIYIFSFILQMKLESFCHYSKIWKYPLNFSFEYPMTQQTHLWRICIYMYIPRPQNSLLQLFPIVWQRMFNNSIMDNCVTTIQWTIYIQKTYLFLHHITAQMNLPPCWRNY